MEGAVHRRVGCRGLGARWQVRVGRRGPRGGVGDDVLEQGLMENGRVVLAACRYAPRAAWTQGAVWNFFIAISRGSSVVLSPSRAGSRKPVAAAPSSTWSTEAAAQGPV